MGGGLFTSRHSGYKVTHFYLNCGRSVMNFESLGSNRQVDLDQLAKDFAKWHGKYQDMILQNSQLQHVLKMASAQVEQDKIAEKSSKEELKRLREIIASLQDSLVKRCDLEDENKELKELVHNLEDTVSTIKEEGQVALEDLKARLEQGFVEDKKLEEQAHRQEVKQMEEQARSLQKTLRDQSAEVKKLHQQLAETEKDRQTEVVKLRLEYDAKLLKLQSTNTKASLHRSDKPSSANSHIFREKMLNAQAASEREVASLRQTVTELRRKLDIRQPSGPGAKRKR